MVSTCIELVFLWSLESKCALAEVSRVPVPIQSAFSSLQFSLQLPDLFVQTELQCPDLSLCVSSFPDVKAEAFFQAGEGREEEGAQGQPGMGAVGSEGKGEELNGGEGHFGPGAPGPVSDGDKDGGTRASGEEQEQKESVAEGTESQKNVKPEDKQVPLQRPRLTQERLRELETILQRGDSFDVPTR